MSIRVIKADYIQHADDMVSLLNRYALDPMGGGKALSEFTQRNLCAELSKIPHAFSVIAYKGSKAIGLINCFEAFSTFACRPLINIHDVFVTKEYRGLGVSQLMLNKVEQIARDKNCCKLTLEILSKNKGAINAYAKFGFKQYELDPTAGSAVFWQKNL